MFLREPRSHNEKKRKKKTVDPVLYAEDGPAGGAALAVIPSRSKDIGPCPEPLPMYGHNFVPVAACFSAL